MRKKLFFTMAATLLGLSAFSQTIIPNGDFENWTTNSSGNGVPVDYKNSNSESEGTFVVTKDAYQGSNAIQLTSDSNAIGYLVKGNLSTMKGGFKIGAIPTGISGFYKLHTANGDSASIIISFTYKGSIVKTFKYKLGGHAENYTAFNYSFTSTHIHAADSMMVAFTSSKLENKGKQNVGNMFIVDKVNFTGLSQQPTGFDGDFENWLIETNVTLNDWYIDGMEGGCNQTTPAYSGNYAVELKSFFHKHDTMISVMPTTISKGYKNPDCDTCTLLGGIPFNSKQDTLEFYYKYAPVGHSSGKAKLIFKKDFKQIGEKEVELCEAKQFMAKEIPFDSTLFDGQTPDSVIITFMSSGDDHVMIDSTQINSSPTLVVDFVNFKSAIRNLPKKLCVEGKDHYCADSVGTTKTVRDSELNVTYTLSNSENDSILNSLIGTGTNISFTGIKAGSYRITAIKDSNERVLASFTVKKLEIPGTPTFKTAPAYGIKDIPVLFEVKKSEDAHKYIWNDETEGKECMMRSFTFNNTGIDTITVTAKNDCGVSPIPAVTTIEIVDLTAIKDQLQKASDSISVLNNLLATCGSNNGMANYEFAGDTLIITTTNVKELANQLSMKVYPNPAKTSFTIESSELLDNIKVFNSMGVLVDEIVPTNQSQTIEVSSYANGVYYLNITKQNVVLNKIVVIQK